MMKVEDNRLAYVSSARLLLGDWEECEVSGSVMQRGEW